MTRRRDQQPRYYEVETACVAVTDVDLLLDIHGTEVWVPRAVLGNQTTLRQTGDQGVAYIKLEWADQKGLP